MFKTFMTGTIAFALIVATVRCATNPPVQPAPAPPTPSAMAPAPLPPHEVPASELVDHTGDSIETAVAVPVDVANEGVDFQKQWIFDRFGRFREKKFAMGHAPGNAGHERHYDIITVELPDGSMHTVFFDMTDYWDHAAQRPKS